MLSLRHKLFTENDQKLKIKQHLIQLNSTKYGEKIKGRNKMTKT